MKRSGRIAPVRRRYPPGFWRKRRAEALDRDWGLCQPCKRRHMFTAATEVDHIIPLRMGKSRNNPDEPLNALSNLQSICGACHAKKTERR